MCEGAAGYGHECVRGAAGYGRECVRGAAGYGCECVRGASTAYLVWGVKCAGWRVLVWGGRYGNGRTAKTRTYGGNLYTLEEGGEGMQCP